MNTCLLFALLPLLITANSGLLQNGAICENKATGFFAIDNIELSAKNSIVYKDTSEDDCLRTCSQNRDQFGRSILCASFVYDHSSFSCTIFKEKSLPEGEGEAVSSVGKRYFEKICLNEDVPLRCAESQFIRVDGSVLVGFAVEVTLADSLEECVAYCAKNSTCKSAMYFYEENECIVNTESALSHPEGFQKENSDKVIYFHNGCHDKLQLQVDPTTPEPSDKHNNKEKNDGGHTEKFGEGEGSAVVPDDYETTESDVSSTSPSSSSTATSSTEYDEELELSKEDPSDEWISSEDEFYDDGESEYVDQESDDDKKEDNSEDLPSKSELTEKSSYTKFKKHHRNFASKTFKTSKTPTQEEIDELANDLSALEQSIAKLSQDTYEEPRKTEGKPSNRKHLAIKKVHKHKGISKTNVEYPNYFSEWSDWTPCTKSGERQIRRRKCLDLRRCLGALMQVQNCPAMLPEPEISSIQSVRSVIGADSERFDDMRDLQPRSDLPPVAPVVTETLRADNPIWSPWLGTCQKFASGQPCTDGQMIGFESRECLAKDPTFCEGPFFRYCSMQC